MMNPRILFIDDEKDLVEDMPTVLGREGFDVRATSDVDEGLAWFCSEHFDGVLLDIAMPCPITIDPEIVAEGRLTGLEVARRMRESKPDIPIMALTVVTDPIHRDSIKNAGIRAVLRKPADPADIINAVRGLISGR